MGKSDHRQTIDTISTQGSYINSRELALGGLPYTARETFIAAPLIAGLNEYLIGATGRGKTQLANDLAGFFGQQYCYAEGRPDFELSELMKQLNLNRLNDAKSDRDLVELTANVQKALYYVDELNRCPPIIQNYFFNFFDGKLVHQGKVHRLGKKGYAVGFASGNVGNGTYVGIEDSDRALKDRMHMIVKLDDPRYSTKPFDKWQIYGGKKDPHATLPQEENDIFEKIVELHAEFGARERPAALQALGVFFDEGLDYLENTSRHSKHAVDNVWPNVQGIRLDTDESKIMPLSPRSVLASIGLTEALAMIAETKGHQNVDHIGLFLDALQFTVPHSGVLAPQFVMNEKDGDAYAAFDAVMEKIREEVAQRREALETAIAYAEFGEKEESLLDKISSAGQKGRWSPVREAIEYVAENKIEEQASLESIREQYKKV